MAELTWAGCGPEVGGATQAGLRPRKSVLPSLLNPGPTTCTRDHH